MTHELVRSVADAVRRAIESVPTRELPITFSSFPRGACGDTALVLGTYFEEDCGLKGFEYVSGDRGSKAEDTWSSHAWLEREGLVVDITADQFADAPSAVIVELASPWHANFRNVERSNANVHAWSGNTSTVLIVYSKVRKLLGSPWRARDA